MAGKNLDTERLAEDLQSLREMNAAQREADARLYKSLMDVSSWWRGTSAEAMEERAARAYAEVTEVRNEMELDIGQTQVYLNRVIEKDRQYANRMAAFGSGNSIGTGVGSVAQQTSRGMQSLEFKEWLSKATGVSADTNALTEHFSKLGFGLSEVYWIYEGLKKNGVTAEHIGNLDKIGYTFDDVAKDYSRITKITDKELYCYMMKGGKGIDREEKKNPGSWKGMLTDIRADGSLSDTTKIRLVSITDGDVTNLSSQKKGISSPGISVTSEYGSETEHESKVEMVAGTVAGKTAGGTKKDRVIGNGLKNGFFIENGKKVYYKDDEQIDIQDVRIPKGQNGLKNEILVENGKLVCYRDDEKINGTNYQEAFLLAMGGETVGNAQQNKMLQDLKGMIDTDYMLDKAYEDPGLAMGFTALGEVETKEVGNTNNVKYNTWYYDREVKDGDFVDEKGIASSYAWCSVFVLWNGKENGFLDGEKLPTLKEEGVYYEGVITLRDTWFKANGHLQPSDGSYEPKTGDVFFKVTREWKPDLNDGKGGYSYQNHTGIVYSYDAEKEKVYVIDGNSGNQVQFQAYRVTAEYENDTRFTGFGEIGGQFSLPQPDEKSLTKEMGEMSTR